MKDVGLTLNSGYTLFFNYALVTQLIGKNNVMRDTERIPRILKKLQVIWLEHPDLRLGQLIENASLSNSLENKLFYIEDDKLEEGLDALKTNNT